MSVEDTHLSGGFSDPSRSAAYAFRAILSAMARPGRIESVDGAAPPVPLSPAAGAAILTLCDRETPLYLAGPSDTEAVRSWVAFHTGAPLVGPETCRFAVGPWDALQPIGRFPVGTSEYPDRSATLIVEMSELSESGARLTGPGIKESALLSLPETEAFRLNARQFPLGLDFIFTCRDRLAATPRTTRVAEEETV